MTGPADLSWRTLGRVGLLLVAALQAGPLRAWKTKHWATAGAPHMYQAVRGMQLLGQRIPGNTHKWAAIQPLLPEGCGTLHNDSNAHGNVLCTLEKVDPEGRPTSDPEPMAFNGGPMFAGGSAPWRRLVL